MSLLNYNERSWAIDVISQINLICSERNLSIKKEDTIYDPKSHEEILSNPVGTARPS